MPFVVRRALVAWAAWGMIGLGMPQAGWAVDECKTMAQGAREAAGVVVRLAPGFNAEAFKSAIDGRVLSAKDGSTFTIEAHLLSATDEVIVHVKRGDTPVVSGSRRVVNGELLGGGVWNYENVIRHEIATLYGGPVAKGLEHCGRGMNAEVEIDGDARPSRIAILRAGRIVATVADPSSSPRLAFDPGAELEPEFRAQLSEYVEKRLADDLSKAHESRELKEKLADLAPVRNTANAGITSALYRLYGDLVPEGTKLHILINNAETFERLDQAARSARAQGQASDQDVRAAMFAVFPETVWGRILKNTRWRLIDIDPDGGNGQYQTLFEARGP